MLTLLLSTALAAQPASPPSHGEHVHDHVHGPHDFKDTAKWVAMFEDPARAAYQKPAEVVAVLRIAEGARIADIGAGSGYFSVPFVRAVGDKGAVYAIDIEPGMVEHLKTRAKTEHAASLKAVLAKPDDPSIPEPVDLVFICDTWHHLEKHGAYLAKVSKSLRPNARIVIVDYQKRDLPVGPPVEMKVSEDDVVKTFADAGFRLARKHEFLPYQYFLEFERK
jgi:ubiquinone/menaquinone biosynthesis C-methylase UbiE